MSLLSRGRGIIPRSVVRGNGSSLVVASRKATSYSSPTSPTSTTSASKSGTGTVKDFLSSSSSNSYLKASLPTSKADGGVAKPEVNPIVQQLYHYSKTFQYDLLLEAFIKWTSTPTGLQSLRSNLSQDQISYFLSLIVKYQGYLIHNEAVNHYSLNRGGKHHRRPGAGYTVSRSKNLKHFSYNIRNVYNNLLFGNQSDNFLYDKKGKRKEREGRGAYQLNDLDYENLYLHEFYSKKMDLADMWLKLRESRSGKEKSISTDAWIQKFKLYSSGVPYSWPVPTSEVYNFAHKTYSRFKGAQRWEDVLQEYMEYCDEAISSTEVALLNKEILEAIVYSVGYAKNLEFLKSFIEKVWGVSTESATGLVVLSRDDPRYPDLDTLKAIVISFSHAGHFYQGMSYINAFQDKYGMETFNLSNKKSIPFWNSIMDGAEKTSRFNEDLALRVYLQNQSLGHLISEKKTEIPTDDADFDQEDYKKFLKGLQDHRVKVVGDIWKLYKQSNTHFSAKIYNIKLGVSKEYGAEADIVETLISMTEIYTKYKNINSNGGEDYGDYSKNIEQIHIGAIKALCELRGKTGDLSEILPIIEEWSINERTKKLMIVWHNQKIGEWNGLLEDKREKAMIRQKSEKEDDEDGFLDLF